MGTNLMKTGGFFLLKKSAGAGNLLKSPTDTICSSNYGAGAGIQLTQIRHNHWPDWRMKKDYRKRQTVIQFSAERDRLNTIRKNNILPREIIEMADVEITKEPRDSSYIRLVNRCAITSRPKGCVVRWRLSRIMFRLLADYNKLSGVQRARW